jgi:hypothetical protein
VDEEKRSTDPMSVWRKTRTEVAGAWRSLRYDLGRRTEQQEPPAAVVPDVTSTGMSTFGGITGHTGPAERYAEPARPRRRLAAAAAFVALAVAGSAGSYLAVVTGFGGLLHGDSAAAGERPLAAAGRAGDAPAGGTDAISRLGRGPAAAVPDGSTAQPVPPQRPAAPATVPPAARPAPPPQRPAQPGTPTREGCDCLNPPVPTPTAPPSSSPSPSPSDSASPSPNASESSDPTGPSADPTASGDDPGDGRRGHRRQ